MTPARKAALQWYERNPAQRLNDHATDSSRPSPRMAAKLVQDCEIEITQDPEWYHDSGEQMVRQEPHSLTDIGRQRLLQSTDWKTYKAHWPSGRAYWTVENRKKNEIRIGGNGGVTRYHDHGQAKDEAERLNGNAPDEDVLDRVGVVTA